MRSTVFFAVALLIAAISRAADAPKAPPASSKAPAKAAKPASPRETIKKKAAELKESPANAALRREILELARGLKPAMPVPEAVDEEFGRAEYAMKDAKSPADFRAAAQSFQKAADLAPWAPDFYFNLGVAHEKAGDAPAAIEAFELYLVGSPDAQDAREVRRRIGGLKLQAEREAGEARAKRSAQDIVDTLNRRFGSKRFPSFRLCGGSSGCNKEERDGRNWTRYDITGESEPEKLSWRLTPEGEIEMNTGFPYPFAIGKPQGSSLSDVKWRLAGETPTPLWIEWASDGEWYTNCYGTDANPDEKPYERFQCRNVFTR